MDKRRILIIDDELGFGELFKRQVEKLGDYECLVATSGQEGLRHVQTHTPDLVLLDILMPDLNGLDVLKQIKAIAPALPVAMVTAVWSQQEAKQCFDAGAYEYVTKPIDFDHLKNTLLVKLF